MLAEQAKTFGAVELCADGNVESLVEAIITVERNHESLTALARERRTKAIEHFSIGHFRHLLVTAAADAPKQESDWWSQTSAAG